MINFSPSILSADFANLKTEIKKVEGAKYLHLDVMDGRFVPNITIGPAIIEAIRPHSSLTFDTHLMIVEPDKYIEQFAAAGSDIITIHAETVTHLDRVVNQIKEAGCKPGIALNPATPLNVLEYILPELELVLLMTVNPGYGGQKFIAYVLDKILKLRQMIDQQKLDVKIEIDGGANLDNIEELSRVGVDIIVAGSAIFGADDPQRKLKEMQKKATKS